MVEEGPSKLQLDTSDINTVGPKKSPRPWPMCQHHVCLSYLVSDTHVSNTKKAPSIFYFPERT